MSHTTSFRARIFSGVILLLLLGITWILGLLSVNYDLQPLHYVYAGFAFLQGLFIFLAYIVGDKKVGLGATLKTLMLLGSGKYVKFVFHCLFLFELSNVQILNFKMFSLYRKQYLVTKLLFTKILINLITCTNEMFNRKIYDIIVGAIQPEEAVV